MDNSKIIQALKDCSAVQFGEFTLASGQKSNFYINIKKASTDPKTLKIIADCIAELLPSVTETPAENVIIGGVELGGVPIATAVSLSTQCPLLIIRKSEKEYGTKSRYVGDLDLNKEIILMEDVTTSGGSVKKAILALKEDGAVIRKVITIVDRESGAAESLKEIGVELIPLVSSSELVE
ncbi:Orotate phosphoribosyltransferase [Methanimicrococcus sp. At1]|uniref:Orotate phosphoribosyltransferase n=1 Tax=Methanimicrococcus hacksteinii TaxID=3028293 RepID=A0ABU3VQG5_9EURY|nr:orotate phosphoribosyltransferase [Methanimicrococcus sp. At1]MDV0445135.1 Orotate phosphoribosyltransferase [Methanimicrococcus sp. At1]